MGEAVGLFKKIGDIKGIFNAKCSQGKTEKVRT